MEYLVTVVRLDTGTTVSMHRCADLGAALRLKSEVFRRHHRVVIGGVYPPLDLDADDLDELRRLLTGEPPDPMPVGVMIHPAP